MDKKPVTSKKAIKDPLCRRCGISNYIHFTEEEKERATSVDLERFFILKGETLLPSGKEKRLARDHSITIRGSKWYDHSAQKGGNAVSLIKKLYDLSYPDSVKMLLEFGQVAPELQVPKKNFALPKSNDNMRRVHTYLTKKRGIGEQVLEYFAERELIYEDAKYHNAVFVGVDETGIARHAHKRSTSINGRSFRQNVDGSDPRCSFNHRGTNGSLYVFEAPIDMLSFITIYPENWQQNSFVACCGVSAQPVVRMINSLEIDTVYLCLDNDAAGLAAVQRMEELLSRKVNVQPLLPKFKDWNEELLLGDSL